RSLDNFRKMIGCHTGNSAFDYIDYGCWCGLGGNGSPLDETDECCYIHDKCYDDIIARSTCGYSFQVYFRDYKHSCTRCEPLSSYPSDDYYRECRVDLCKCDSEAAKCFKQARFNPDLEDYDNSKCKNTKA
ncbi:predicted protein, partial [Nematostella vectensis]